MKQQQQTTEIIMAAIKRSMTNRHELAKDAGVASTTFYDWVKNPSEFRLGALIATANAVGLTDEEWIALRRGK